MIISNKALKHTVLHLLSQGTKFAKFLQCW